MISSFAAWWGAFIFTILSTIIFLIYLKINKIFTFPSDEEINSILTEIPEDIHE